MKLKRWIAYLFIVLIAVSVSRRVISADDVSPVSCSFTNTRGEAQETISGTFYTDTTLLLTNCQTMVDSSTTQGLDTVVVEVKVGATSAGATTYTGTVTTAASGLYCCTSTVPTNVASAYIQIKITDANDNSYIYPWKTIRCKDTL